ncbi:thiamine-phosphate kinase [Desulfobulbus sp. AH-315-M07]|nr:thiamine-phosphate kinase [Desulfobulbus sp. AH-315-M07]
MNERELIARLAKRFGVGAAEVGIGDDAAVVDGVVLSVDSQVEGVHFDHDWLSLEDVGFRATMAAASDLAAMGARPTAVLAALVVPDHGAVDGAVDAISIGQAQACEQLGVPLVGGNLSRGGELSIATTVVGTVERPLLRSGTRAGSHVFVCGALGMAAAGLRALQRGDVDGCAEAVAAWRRPTAQIAAGLAAAKAGARAAIDISDGLARDAGHVAEASGVALVFDAEALVSADLAVVAKRLGDDALSLVAGGEDYALLVCGDEAPPGFRKIGECDVGEGVWLLRDGVRERWTAGFDHFQ